MNKITTTDVVFYLSMTATAWKAIADQVNPLVSSHTFALLSLAATVIGTLAYAFYEKINGTMPPPQP